MNQQVSNNSPEARHLSPAWSDAHDAAAATEGWCISDSTGSVNGPWQVQRIDDPGAFELAAGFAPGVLASDDDALRLVANGNGAHHLAARVFMQAHNPSEFEAILKFLDAAPGGSPTGVATVKAAVANLSGYALNWAVAKCEGLDVTITPSLSGGWNCVADRFRPSVDPRDGVPIIERDGITIRKHKQSGTWYAMALDDAGDGQRVDWAEFTFRGGERYGAHSYEIRKRRQSFAGPTALVSAMRCYVASRLGAEPEIPVVLLNL
ncbi:phage protein NinX family protein [Paraburkholderia sp. SIMBA_054]|uniref:phage protein NinX family protein n=1 Tax=Paraburkholderia sp. SIMBA_054 TaxID=3085795 RepID=UPI003979189D